MKTATARAPSNDGIVIAFVCLMMVFAGVFAFLLYEYGTRLGYGGDPSRPPSLITVNSVTGPFRALKLPDGSQETYEAGDPLTAVPAGTRFAWINDMDVAMGSEGCATATLRRISDGFVPKDGTQRYCNIRIHEHRTGPRVATFKIPEDTPPGSYELARIQTIRKPPGPMGEMTMPSLYLAVVPPSVSNFKPVPPESFPITHDDSSKAQ